MQVGLQFLHQAGADLPRVAGGQLRPHVDKVHRGQGAATVALVQCDQPQAAGLGGIVGLGAGGGGGKHQQGVFSGGALAGHIVGGIAGRGLALIGVLLLLIDQDQANILQRGEHRAAGPHHNVRLAGLDQPPLQKALGVVEG